ncbi:MAG: CDP-glucose 4,6-dehydratase [Cyanothece sp. SIO1E1]|nr:CDP-glucose 4,6-dehydratase [Cyanothece sp. SIO1E1]
MVDHQFLDVRDYGRLKAAMEAIQPDFIFHLAAQPIVKRSYRDPLETFEVNVMGTGNILEVLRTVNLSCVAVFITSDKCYDNVEWIYGYRENDPVGGKDPYSGSKGGAELIIKSYFHSFFASDIDRIRLGVGRAGNVVGGADWAADRIVPDCMRSWSKGEAVDIRSPHATRPWQHVLEPLSGYLALGQYLAEELQGDSLNRQAVHGEAFNFGPDPSQDVTVGELIECMREYWEDCRWNDVSQSDTAGKEAGLLKLCCDKALSALSWKACMTFDETVKFTVDWYREYYAQPGQSIRAVTEKQLDSYMRLAADRGLSWIST